MQNNGIIIIGSRIVRLEGLGTRLKYIIIARLVSLPRYIYYERLDSPHSWPTYSLLTYILTYGQQSISTRDEALQMSVGNSTKYIPQNSKHPQHATLKISRNILEEKSLFTSRFKKTQTSISKEVITLFDILHKPHPDLKSNNTKLHAIIINSTSYPPYYSTKFPTKNAPCTM